MITLNPTSLFQNPNPSWTTPHPNKFPEGRAPPQANPGARRPETREAHFFNNGSAPKASGALGASKVFRCRCFRLLKRLRALPVSTANKPCWGLPKPSQKPPAKATIFNCFQRVSKIFSAGDQSQTSGQTLCSLATVFPQALDLTEFRSLIGIGFGWFGRLGWDGVGWVSHGTTRSKRLCGMTISVSALLYIPANAKP